MIENTIEQKNTYLLAIKSNKTITKFTAFFLLQLSLISMLFSEKPESEISPEKFSACPGTPNCVNSQEKSKWGKLYNIEPLTVPRHITDPIDTLKNIFNNINEQYLKAPNLQLLEERENYLHYAYVVVIHSLPLRGTYIDDIEISYDKDRQILDIRSASRSGYRDATNLNFSIPGANKNRVEALRTAWTKYTKTI